MSAVPMPVNVLVVFYSRHGHTERLALAAGLGAIQEEGLIRLRRLADRATDAEIDADPDWRTQRARMERDYVTPRPADPVWADLIVVAAPPQSHGEVEEYIATLASCGPMAGKMAAPIAAGSDVRVLHGVYAACACAGLLVSPSTVDERADSARTHGQALVRTVRALKAAAQA
jgi:hypothetical protein